ncbi:flavoprotein [Paratractidigestivibacter sp.]|uniref:flavoprotein n=1 Tax=Paratractidigestivibacter sp. TaxID=2847316 RepID=UPI002ABE98EE|nr:flavoprotein [Paratractidigestivibacter sp.]
MHENLNETIENAVRTVIRSYIEAIRARQLNVLVVFTGAKLGCADAVASLSTLRDKGYAFNVLMSEKAASILDIESIDQALLPQNIWVGQPPVHAEQLAREADTIVVPTLSASSCSHVANILTDTPAQACITESLMLGKSVICAVDGCCPDNPLRAEEGFKFTEAMAQRMRDNRDAVRDYGAAFTPASKLADKVLSVQEQALRAALGLAEASAAPSSASACAKAASAATAPSGSVVYEGGNVLSATFVRTLVAGTVVSVPEGTLVSPLARDLARTNNITLISLGRQAD